MIYLIFTTLCFKTQWLNVGVFFSYKYLNSCLTEKNENKIIVVGFALGQLVCFYKFLVFRTAVCEMKVVCYKFSWIKCEKIVQRMHLNK